VASRSWVDKDFYELIGVPKTASADEIKKAYRKLALKHHPDRNPGDKDAEDRFKDIGEAYAVLSDASKRAEYDQLRDAMAAGGGRFSGGFRPEDFGFGEEFDLQDFLQTVLGGRGGGVGGFSGFGARHAGPRRGRDIETTIDLSFEEAVLGTERSLSLEIPVACSTCNGAGGSDVRTCARCGGSGVISATQGLFAMQQGCPECQGSGRVVKEVCATCSGSGVVRGRRDVTVKIPAGVTDGSRIRVRERGEAGPGGSPAGDLYVRTRVGKHRFFGRRGDDLTLTMPISYREATLGANVKVPTLDGAVTLKIPAGTSSGKTFRIRGRGVPRPSSKGDLLVTVQVAVPQKPSKREREAVEALAEFSDDSIRSHLGV